MGAWEAGGVSDAMVRERVKPYSGDIAPGWRAQLTVSLPRGVLGDLRTQTPPTLPNSTGLDVLRRARVRVPKDFPLRDTSFGPGLYMHTSAVFRMGHAQLGKTIKGILMLIHRRVYDGHFPRGHEDDAVRQLLKILHDAAFPRTVTEGPGWMFLCHLQALGGRRPWDRDAVEKRIADWVNSDRLFLPTPQTEAHLDKIFTHWTPRLSETNRLSFREFCDDPLRWGTSGGAKKTQVQGKAYRTKWAWAFGRVLDKEGRLRSEYDLYGHAMTQKPDTAVVALKEEATKTREIITTPMSSYLRQAYLGYLWGRPPVDSPIGRKQWLASFQARRYKWYAAIDGKNFDHHISFEFIKSCLRRLGTAGGDAERVAQEEIEHMERLVVTDGEGRSWKYKNGVLSGWRLTSLLDTLATECVIDYILGKAGVVGQVQHGSMGDDLILGSDTVELENSWLAETYDETGMETNKSKTTGGAVGEFLRKVYAPQGILGYPALGLKSILWASPWIANFEAANPQEVSKNWMCWLSRMLPLTLTGRELEISDYVRLQARRDLLRWNPALARQPLDEALATPVSAGGLGCNEWSGPRWAVVKNSAGGGARGLLQRFGIAVEMKLSKVDYEVQNADAVAIRALADQLKRVHFAANEDDPLPPNVNLTKAIVPWFIDEKQPAVAIGKALGIRLPYGLRVAGKSAILDHLLGAETGNVPGITSIQVTPESVTSLAAMYKKITRTFLSSKRGKAIRYLPAATTYLQMITRGKTSVTRGTW